MAGTEPALDHAAPPPRQPLPRPHAAAERTEHRGGADSVSRESSMFAVRLLLRAGASPRAAAAGVANAPTPLSLARQSSSAAAALVPFPTPLLPTHTRHTDTPRHLHATQRHTSRLAPPHMLVVILSCDQVVAAAEPWSPASHGLWPERLQRFDRRSCAAVCWNFPRPFSEVSPRLAVELLTLGYLLAREVAPRRVAPVQTNTCLAWRPRHGGAVHLTSHRELHVGWVGSRSLHTWLWGG